MAPALDDLNGELVLGVRSQIVQHGVQVGGVAVVVLRPVCVHRDDARVPEISINCIEIKRRLQQRFE